jgi:indolepyruvate ferredoxin oxidoreductase beta subunit
MSERITNILVAGVGGQGVMTATEILAQAAIAQGYDVKKTEVAGMAQRGGVVNSHLRFGHRVLSPVIPAGCADFLVAFEVAEGLRWSGDLRPGGVALVSRRRLSRAGCLPTRKILWVCCGPPASASMRSTPAPSPARWARSV